MGNKQLIEMMAKQFKNANKIVILSGAGVSTESGIPDFRSAGGVYNTPQVMRRMSVDYFNSNPKEFWPQFKETFQYKMRDTIKPNYGHEFLKELEDMGKEVIIVTQNVDGLHTEAGSSNVLEAHGTIQTASCPKCNKTYDLDYILKDEIPRCNCTTTNFILKPSVVLFGDEIKHLRDAVYHTLSCDLFVVLGSSLQVFPINGLVDAAYNGYYKFSKKETMRASKYCEMSIINREETTFEDKFNISIKAGIGETLSAIKLLF